MYREFKKAGGGGADGHVVGLNGSINPRCVEIVLTWMEVNGKAVLDFGCASGKFLVCASVAGAHRAIGVELPDNKAQKYIFDAATNPWSAIETRPSLSGTAESREASSKRDL